MNNFDVWQFKLGNPNANIVKKVLTTNKIPSDNITLPYICTFFQIGKSHMLAFSDSLTKYDKPLELIATDLGGPTPINFDYGFKYYIYHFLMPIPDTLGYIF